VSYSPVQGGDGRHGRILARGTIVFDIRKKAKPFKLFLKSDVWGFPEGAAVDI